MFLYCKTVINLSLSIVDLFLCVTASCIGRVQRNTSVCVCIAAPAFDSCTLFEMMIEVYRMFVIIGTSVMHSTADDNFRQEIVQFYRKPVQTKDKTSVPQHAAHSLARRLCITPSRSS